MVKELVRIEEEMGELEAKKEVEDQGLEMNQRSLRLEHDTMKLSSCQVCSVGHFAPIGSLICLSCSRGSYNDSTKGH